jgi:Flp pilus assembly pilin Flp
MTALHRLLREEDGLETVEYAVIAGLIVSALVVLLIAIGNWVRGQYSNMQTEMGA